VPSFIKIACPLDRTDRHPVQISRHPDKDIFWREKNFLSGGDTSVATMRPLLQSVLGDDTSMAAICPFMEYVTSEDSLWWYLWRRYVRGNDTSLTATRHWRRYVLDDNTSMAAIRSFLLCVSGDDTSMVVIRLWRRYNHFGDTSRRIGDFAQMEKR